MKKLLAIATLVVALCPGAPTLTAQGTSKAPAPSADGVSVDAIIAALYASVSHPNDGEPNFDRMRAIFLPVGMLIPPKKPQEDLFTVLDVDGFQDRVVKFEAAARSVEPAPPEVKPAEPSRIVDTRTSDAKSPDPKSSDPKSHDAMTNLVVKSTSAPANVVRPPAPIPTRGETTQSAASKRIAAVPDVPTMVENGFPTMTIGSWQGVFVPKGAPRDVLKQLYAAVIKTMEDAAVKKRLGDGGVEVVVSKSPEAFGAFVKAENERWAKVIKEAGVVAE
jgi:hypothetical protein